MQEYPSDFDRCLFCTDSVRYLGHIVRPGTLEVDKSLLNALRYAEQPRTMSEQRSFLEFVYVYRRFVPDYTAMIQPLHKILKGGGKAIPKLNKEKWNPLDL